jgi:hypothetical protein
VVSPTLTQISFTADEALLADLERLKALWGHQKASQSYAELIRKLAKLALDQADKKFGIKKGKDALETTDLEASTKTRAASPPIAHEVPDADGPPLEFIVPSSRHIPDSVRREVWKRDEGRCTYSHQGRRCESRFALEVDHLDPYAFGGSHSPENLQLLCRAHHQLKSAG